MRDVALDASSFRTETGLSIGTPGYMSPEQYGDARSATPAADLYAVGVMLWELLTGRRPWEAPNTNMMFHLQVTTAPALPPGAEMAPDLLAMVRRLLLKEPERRPQRARDVGVELASLVPAIPPFVPSGAEILRKVAPEFLKEASPHDGTLRNRGGELVYAASSWNPPATHVPPLQGQMPQTPFLSVLQAVTVDERAMVPRADGGKATPYVSNVATIGRIDVRRRLWSTKVVIVGLTCALVVGLSTFAFIGMHHIDRAAGRRADLIDAGVVSTGQDSATVVIQDAALLDKEMLPTPSENAGSAGFGIRASSTQTRKPGRPSGAQPIGATPKGSGSHSVPTKKFDPDAVEE